MRIVQILKTENNITWQGAILGLGDDGRLYELRHDNKGWILLTEPLIVSRYEKND